MLEFKDRFEELEFRRGSTGGSNQPFTVHLFTGGLLFESLLKHFYPKKMPDSRKIEQCLKDGRFKDDFPIDQVKCNEKSLKAILKSAQNEPSPATAFEVAGKLRNTTGHNLVWDDVFDNPQAYLNLYEQVMNALFYLIEKNTDGLAADPCGVKRLSKPTPETTATEQTAPHFDSGDTSSYTSTVTIDRVVEVIRNKPNT